MMPLPGALLEAIYKLIQSLVEHGLKPPFYIVGNFATFPDGLRWNTEMGEVNFVRDSEIAFVPDGENVASQTFIFDQEGFDTRYERPSYQDALKKRPVQ